MRNLDGSVGVNAAGGCFVCPGLQLVNKGDAFT